MTRRDLEESIQRLVDGTLEAAEFTRLQEELRANEDSRTFYRKSMEVEMLLAESMGQRLEIRSTKNGMDQLLQRRRKRDATRASLVTAAILVLAAVVMSLIIIKPPEPTLSCNLVPGTQWEVVSNNPDATSDSLVVSEGSTVRVLSGTVRMELESGAVMVMRGPAEARFPKLQEPELEHGWLWIDSGDAGESFTITTPEMIVKNVGTRFGVRVREEGQTEIHLIKGRLEASSKIGKDEPTIFEPKESGFLLSAENALTELPLAPDPFPELPELLASTSNFRTTLLSQGPVGYWRLNTPSEKILVNEIAEGAAGYRGNGALPGEPGIGSDGNFKGFSNTNRAIRLSGDPLTSVITKIDVPGGVSREEGGVAFWIRCPAESNREEILWLAGKTPDDDKVFPKEAFMHLRLSSSGRVEFVIENGEFDVLLTSNSSVADGGWHQIAASWGPSAVELYVDGRRVQLIDDFGSLQEGVMHGEYVRFGKPSDDLLKEGKSPFTGWVDEIALWNRPLGRTEVSQQYRAARGEGH